ncbi:ABC-2 type transport system ATP-binding protein/lipopolysaccharide transport system ATP-binding protein [Friedmanniella endophytica]|uniref:ABC-2 type transport system ATP-binding protein/lipopolysaccharide transport system ATP-binding protein n=1 Tax=Microlunatus kandeliicorticis TaxID=1759536 RepID=A0A7W3IS47_9ACTN|nr:polysaccharide ABC transporter ATP-binding protein [Microlunatus kandeliicorticis]MBA8794244.1 ABC-2 type transport system ATP-binding protein/lipopolysaccharide transport system ATP-binding protein [Microlunatus kandeliicorticis]
MSTVIEVERLGKRYRLGHRTNARETIMEALARPFRGPADPGQLWSLRDVGFTVVEGESIGIVGANGAGKSTLLKILAGITAPTEGVARTRGRVAPLLEVGTGFHPELSGRENVFLNGAVLGLSRRDIARRFDDIVAFSGVERFLDTPVKRYSSGMYLRLAFSVAAHLEPDVLVVDEVLAVGDAEFQERCLGRMREAGRAGRTVVFVSHDLGALARLCPRSLWLDRGRLRADGQTEGVIRDYLAAGSVPETAQALPEVETGGGRGPVRLRSVEVTRGGADLGDARGAATVLLRGDALAVRIAFDVLDAVPGLDLAVYLTDGRGVRLLDQTLSDDPGRRGLRTGPHRLVWELPPMFNVGEFSVGVWAGTAHDEYLDLPAAGRFTLRGGDDDRPDRVVTTRFPLHVEPDDRLP